VHSTLISQLVLAPGCICPTVGI